MNTIKLLGSLLLTAFALSACNDESSEPSTQPKVPMTFYAGTETDTSLTRAALQPNNDVFWETADEISILYLDGDNNPVNDKFTLETGAGSCKASFTGLASKSEAYVALYPYQKSGQVGFTLPLTATINHVSLPTMQAPTANTFDRQAALQMSAPTETNTLAFYNVTSLLKLTPKFDCNSIVIETQDALPLSGVVSLSYQDKFPVATTENSKGSYQVALCGDIKKNTTYYVAVLPETTTQQLRITYRNEDKSYTECKGTAPIQLNRAGIKNIPTPATAPASSELVDLGLSVLWSKQNLGAASPTEKGTLYAWDELAPKQEYTSVNYRYNASSSYPTTLDDDIAKRLSNGKLRMPTSVEIQELLDSCTWTLEGTEPDYTGYTVTSNVKGYENVSIFLPFVENKSANYWSSTSNSGNANQAQTILIGVDTSGEVPSHYHQLSATAKYQGCALRPVAAK